MEKNGMLTEQSYSDFDRTQKAKYIEKHGEAVAGEADKHNLRNPVPLFPKAKAELSRPKTS